MKYFDTQISESHQKKYLKVFLKDNGQIHQISAILNPLNSVQNCNVSPWKGDPEGSLTVYPSRVYDIEETKAEVEFTLGNYFGQNKGKFDPVFNTDLISDITDKAYRDIIQHILTFGQNLEKYHDLYSSFDEEKFRDYFLPYLNAVSTKHTATGETFNKIGKTDILIQDNNGGNVFIAECKLWKGSSELKKAVDQLLNRYVRWRDEKVALIVFNKDHNSFSELIQTAIDALKQHPNFHSYSGKTGNYSYAFIFKNPEDSSQHISLELILFNCK